MTDQPNPDDFSVDEKPREYEIRIRVEGEIHRTIEADSQEQAEAMAGKIEDDIFEDKYGAEVDEIDDVRVVYCRRARPMFRVIRDGQKMQVSHLGAGDVPREPDERGF